MRHVQLAAPTDFASWRTAARRLYQQGIAPEAVTWSIAGEARCAAAPRSLFEDSAEPQLPAAASPCYDSPTVPREFLMLAQATVLHRDPARFALLYRLLWRLQAEPQLLADAMDPDVHIASSMAAAVHREIHKMHAFVRFREVPGISRRLIAWFEPQHHIVEAAAPFFVERFANLSWAILTPLRRAVWDRRTLHFGPGGTRAELPSQDAAEMLWRQYYASIFNPTRLNTAAMHAHMPRRFWRNLPEAELIPTLVGSAHVRTLEMIDKAPDTPRRVRNRTAPAPAAELHSGATLKALHDSALGCRACPLWRNATQTVFGEGPPDARIMLVGEQPGDQEDLQGHPFVGPAGRLLDRALAEAGIDRTVTYITNAVKHFKFEPRGKRRLHKKPNDAEILACHPWLEREITLLSPTLIIALGATAARAVLGRATPIEKNRGRILSRAEHLSLWQADILISVHPSALLRMPGEDRTEGVARFVADLTLAAPYART